MADVEVSDEKQQLKGSGIVIPNPKPNKGYASKVVDLIEKLIVRWMYDSSQPHHYLAGNFAPVVDETPPTTNLPVIGHLPVTFSLSLSLSVSPSLSLLIANCHVLCHI